MSEVNTVTYTDNGVKVLAMEVDGKEHLVSVSSGKEVSTTLNFLPYMLGEAFIRAQQEQIQIPTDFFVSAFEAFGRRNGNNKFIARLSSETAVALASGNQETAIKHIKQLGSQR